MNTFGLLLILLFGTVVSFVVGGGLTAMLASLLNPRLEMEVLAYGYVGAAVSGLAAFIGLFYWIVGA